jgi:hypothetical protein
MRREPPPSEFRRRSTRRSFGQGVAQCEHLSIYAREGESQWVAQLRLTRKDPTRLGPALVRLSIVTSAAALAVSVTFLVVAVAGKVRGLTTFGETNKLLTIASAREEDPRSSSTQRARRVRVGEHAGLRVDNQRPQRTHVAAYGRRIRLPHKDAKRGHMLSAV